MPCISINMPSALLAAQGALGAATELMLKASGESCNLFGILGLDDLETGIQSLLGTIGNAMGFINNAIAQIQNILNSVLDTAAAFVSGIMETILGGLGSIVDFAQSAVTSVTGMIDGALAMIGQSAGVSELLACTGVVGQLLNLPSGVTDNIDKITGLLSGGTPITDIANAVIADAKNAFANEVNSKVDELLTGIEDKVNGSQDLIDLSIRSLGSVSCVV